MKNKNLILGISVAVGVIAAGYFMSKKGRFNLRSMTSEAETLINGMTKRFAGQDSTDDVNLSSHDGRHLADKIRHKVEHQLANARKS